MTPFWQVVAGTVLSVLVAGTAYVLGRRHEGRVNSAAPALLAACLKYQERDRAWSSGRINAGQAFKLDAEARELRDAAIAKAEGR